MGQGKRTRRKFTDEFKRNAVELVRTTGRPIATVADELGIYDSNANSVVESPTMLTLGSWVKADRVDRVDRGQRDGLTCDERVRLAELEAENAQLRMERGLLKRTTAFWVKEPTR